MDRSCVGFQLRHRIEVKLEVAEMAPAGPLVGLLGKDDFGDKACVISEASRAPGDIHARHLALEALQEAEEVPNCEDVVLHKYADALPAGECCIQGMVNEPTANGVE